MVFTNSHYHKLISTLAEIDISLSPVKKQVLSKYTGDQYYHIRLMEVMDWYPLMVGHTFAQKETLQINVAKEVNLQNIKMKVLESCKVYCKIAGDKIYVKSIVLDLQGMKGAFLHLP